MHANNRAFPDKGCRTPLRQCGLTRYLLAVTVVIGLSIMGSPAYADDSAGLNLWSGTVARIIEVNSYKIVDNVDPATIGLPKKFIIDIKAKKIRPSKESVIRKTIALRHIANIEGSIIFQGVDDGVEGVNDTLAWSLTLSKKEGHAVLAASGDKVAYVVFGTVVPLTKQQ